MFKIFCISTSFRESRSFLLTPEVPGGKLYVNFSSSHTIYCGRDGGK